VVRVRLMVASSRFADRCALGTIAFEGSHFREFLPPISMRNPAVSEGLQFSREIIFRATDYESAASASSAIPA